MDPGEPVGGRTLMNTCLITLHGCDRWSIDAETTLDRMAAPPVRLLLRR
jgi:hypothetical protein